ncbi:DNA polymerase III subunit beta [Floccifex sp.]|uniref:DNA polymerase III subunit beta n=1 Tax=Floccifex sp. TaxID=2815810 RepID=UPI002A75D3C3|nr:DNA polymerase III subunit beta [Floccifex sp.]MDD7280559.1 DNA polymerase III subunit beta [Erysipelotrichaceae bacterium]MDY2958626.1 DNA polymerase III subunit beta [Floccifex sp.]
MKFSINRKFFLDKLNIVSRSISVFSPLPALSGICIKVEDNRIILTGSDSNISIRSTIVPNEENELKIDSTGSIIIESKYLLEIVRKLDSQSLQFDLIDLTKVCISNNKGKFNLNGIESNEYPNIDFSIPGTKICLKSEELKQIYSQTAFACSDKDTRPVLNGVNFKTNGNILSCSGTDSYRLARKTVEINGNYNFNITIPNKSLSEVVKSLSDSDEYVDLYIDSKKIQFVFNQTVIQSRLIDGIFPDIDRIIPTTQISSMCVSSHEMASVIDRTNFIRNEKIHLIKLECSESETHIKTSSTEIGNSDEILSTCEYTGEPIRLSCNGTYMLEAIRALSGDKVKLEFAGLMKPIKISNPDDDSALMIVVPVRSYD